QGLRGPARRAARRRDRLSPRGRGAQLPGGRALLRLTGPTGRPPARERPALTRERPVRVDEGSALLPLLVVLLPLLVALRGDAQRALGLLARGVGAHPLGGRGLRPLLDRAGAQVVVVLRALGHVGLLRCR